MLAGIDEATAARRLVAAATPPMGWNSWDCFGPSVREDEVKANADYMAANLRRYGWEYVVVDIQWYEPTASDFNYHPGAKLDMDTYGRLIPSVNRFPSAANGQGFRALSKYCQDRGLKFGIHILRGIPRQAVAARTPILGTNLTAADIADTSSICAWNTDMYGVDAARPGSQAWYDSLIRLYHDWGVDFIKVDDLSSPYATGEIELIRNAIDRYAPQIVFSASPGETPIAQAQHARTHLNMWRISNDFWDDWPALRHAFDLCARWQGIAAPGHWPDADMLPFGHIALCDPKAPNSRGAGRQTHFTKDEQVTVMTLWCMARSPLIFGGNLPDMDPWTLSLLTNTDVLAIQKRSKNNRQLSRDGDHVVWTAEGERGGARYAALFNLGEHPATVGASLSALGLSGPARARDLWTGADLPAPVSDTLSAAVPPHGARLFRLTPA